jgi:NADPH2:quinone reductase
MRAVLCKQFGPPESLVVETVPDLVPGPGQVLIDVKACGVNFPDTLIIQGKYQFQPEMPFSPGGEAAGIVRSVGEGVTAFKAGDRVMAFTGWGAFAEQLLALEPQVMPIPEGMDFDTAAGFVLTYGTTHYALKDRAQLKAGETLLVLGAAGGVGLAAIEIGKIMGARVIAAASSEAKLAFCKANGADEGINYAADDLRKRVKALTASAGVDVVYDPVGGVLAEPAVRSMAWGGRYLVIGFASGEIPKIPLNLTLLKSCSLTGVFWGAFTAREPARNRAHLAELAGWFREGKLKPQIYARYPLAQTAQALQDILERRVMGKVVLTTETPSPGAPGRLDPPPSQGGG